MLHMFCLSFLSHTQDTKYCMWLSYYPQSSGMHHGGGHLSQSIYQYLLWIRKKNMTGLNQDKYRILTISVVCGRAHVLFAFSVFVSAQWCLTHIVLCFWFFFVLCFLVFLDCPFLIAPSVFFNVYFIKWKKKIITNHRNSSKIKLNFQ